MKYIVKIIDKETKEVLEEILCTGEGDAQCIADGVRIKLNHREFLVEIICTEQ